MPSLVGSEMCIRDSQNLMRSQRAAPSDHHPSGLIPFVPRSLKDASMVLVQHDGVRRPLQAPYDGPYPVLESGDKVFKILRNGLPYSVSVDRLKPCNIPVTPPFSSIIPNKNPPPPHPPTRISSPSGPRPGPDPQGPSAAVDPCPTTHPVLDPSRPTSSTAGGSSPVDISSETEFPALKPPLYTSSGRRSRPRVRMDL